jgi:hypothetical protein
VYPPAFTQLFQSIAAGKCAVTIVQLAAVLQLDDGLGALGKVARLREILTEHKLKAIPDLGKGELDTVRTIIFEPAEAPPTEILAEDVKANEAPALEFKASFRFHIKRYEAQPEPKKPEECASDEIIHASLKTVAAFANSEGGRLYVGITDDRKICGLDWDFRLKETTDVDLWEQYFREIILRRCKDGQMVNDYVGLRFVPNGERIVARIDVVPRAALTFIKVGSQYQLFRRQGNRTIQVEIQDIEEFLRSRWAETAR